MQLSLNIPDWNTFGLDFLAQITHSLNGVKMTSPNNISLIHELAPVKIVNWPSIIELNMKKLYIGLVEAKLSFPQSN